ncbi:GGDEF domain-containing protein [Virgisporangium ochraceum]|uniref:GGDEF domain-containing protein n=1 Tax=Virgisporangium ochraceum TaxID=65505 RepID=UPI001EF1D2F7|nr:GGDEF domain-containing protein [Virgisporangium ochraceum]
MSGRVGRPDAYQAVAVPVVLVAVVATLLAPASTVGQVAYLVGFAVVVGTAWRAIGRPSAGGRGPWVMVAAAVTVWLAGDLLWTGLALAGHEPTVGLPDVLWLSGYPLLGAGLVGMVRRRAPAQAAAALQDGLTLTTAAALAAWQFLVAPGLATSAKTIEIVVGTLYPLGDIVLLAAMLYLVLSPGVAGRPTRLLLAGASTTLCVDVAFTLLPRFIAESDVDRLNGLLLLANAMIVAAVAHPRRDELVTPTAGTEVTLHPARVVFLGLAVLTAPMMAVTRGHLELAERVPLIAGTVLTIAFSLTRFTSAVHEQQRSQRLLSHLAGHDALTGLVNRRGLADRLRSGGYTVLLYVDLDGFKSVNDTYGHAAGDAVLTEVARRLHDAVRTGDLVARLGGDEFAILCVDLDLPSAEQLAWRLVGAVEEPVTVDGHPLRVGASIGVAGAHLGDGEELLLRADHAMLDAKRAGRGRVVLAAPPVGAAVLSGR